jgi:MFS family permease
MNLSEFRSGWKVLILALLGIAVSINAVLLYGFGALVIPFEEAFGWDRGSQQVAISFLYGGAVIGLQAVGWVNIAFGVRATTVASLLLMGLGYLACIPLLGGSIWSLYILFGILPIVGMGALAITWTQLINLWFVENRGLALAIGLSGTGLTAAVMPSAIAACIESWGWPSVFVLLAVLNFVLIPLTLMLFRFPRASLSSSEGGDESKSIAALGGVDFKKGVVSRRFWTCNIAIALVVSAVMGMITNGVPMLQSMGFSGKEAGYIFSTFGASLVLGRLTVGFFLDRYWPPGVAAFSLMIPAVGCVIFYTGSGSIPVMMLAVGLVGVGAGAEFDVAAFLVAKFFGLKDYGRLMGFHQALITVASAMAPLLFAAMYKASAGYQAMLLYCIFATAVGGAMLLSLGRPPEFSGGQAKAD